MDLKKLFLIFGGIVSLFVVMVIAVGAILTAQKQTPEKSVSPTVPQSSPRAAEPTTTAACATTFTVVQITHKECKNNTCATVTGAGQDTCSSDSQCIPATYSYKTCENNACVNKDCNPKTSPCPSLNTCQTDADCKQTYQHKVCLGASCSLVQCSPSTSACADTCSSDAMCVTAPPPPPPPSSPQTHRACQNNTCATVSGAGADTCTSDVSCQPKAVAPPIPRSGSTEITIASILLGAGALFVGLLLAF